MSQNFTGEIEYKISYLPKTDNVNIDSIKANSPGNKAIYIIKDGQYKNSYYKNDVYNYSYTYDNVSKRMYDDNIERDYITYRDSRKANLEMFESEVFKDSLSEILGRECFLVKYAKEKGTSKTLYSNSVRVNFSSFEDHKVGNWYERIKEVDGCISLKTITEYDDYYIINEAIRINERPVNEDEFKLPKDKLIVASYSALDKNVDLNPPTQETINCYREKVQNALKSNPITEPLTIYLSLIVHENGEITNIETVEKDELGLYQTAIDILKNCDLKFIPGQIEDKAISSIAYFPIQFQ